MLEFLNLMEFINSYEADTQITVSNACRVS